MLKRKKCNVDGCQGLVWKGGKCLSHMEKGSGSSLKRGGFKSSKKLTQSSAKSKKEYDPQKMRDMFQELWDEMEHPRLCYETGVDLGSTPNTMMFHHMLPKSKYPQFTLCKWNIVVLHPDVHAKLEMNLDKAPKVKELTLKLREEWIHNK